MNILILNWKDLKNSERGGAEIIVYELAKRLVKKGHQVTWFCRGFRGAKEKETYDGIKIIRQGGMLSTYLKAWRYYKNLKQKPDLVIDMVNTLAWQTPLYVHPSTSLRAGSKKILYVNQLAKEVLFYHLPPIISHLLYFLENFQFLSYKKTPALCYSQSTKQDLISVGIPVKNIQIFPMGLDHSRHFKAGKKSREPLFLCVNRLVKMKRTDLVVEAMAKVVKKYPKAKLAIVGSGPEKENLERQISELGLNKNVIFPQKNIWIFKKISGDLRIDLMRQGWALVLPSVKEGWGMVVTEAAACGTLSIVSNATGLRDSTRHMETGIVLSKNPDSKELARVMVKIVADSKLRNELSKNAILWAKSFSWEKSFREFEKQIARIFKT